MFAALLTLVLLPFPTSSVQAAEYATGYSCVAIRQEGAGMLTVGDHLINRCNYSPGLTFFSPGRTPRLIR